MIGLAAAILLTPVSAPGSGTAGYAGPAAHPGYAVYAGHAGPAAPLSVAVQTSGGRDVSYAIVVRNTTDRAVSDAVVTQQLPASLDFTGATPTPQRTGRHLTWTLAIPAHGTAHITTTGAPAGRLGARPLDHVTQAGALRRGHHGQLTTTVCVREDAGPEACAIGRSTLRAHALSRGERIAAGMACAAGVTAACLGAVRVWRRRRRRGAGRALGRAGVEG